MEAFATITTTRGDRSQFLENCKKQINRFTIQPKHVIIVDEEPKSNAVDLTRRLKMGITAAKGLGIDIVYVVEDDDFYPKDYIEKMWIGGNDFIGCSKTLYYNIQNRTYNEFTHPGRSSLFCTGFRISALEGFDWPPDDTIFLDIILWKYAMKRGNVHLQDSSIGVGIKHGIGKRAGSGHRMEMPHKDSADMSFLRSKVDSEAFEFYKTLL
jgi:hypothetical protein